jgi:diacylglycerol O-acyltransferase / wax synthase
VARLTAVGTETAVRKARHDAEELDELMNRMDRFSPRLAAWSQRLQRCGAPLPCTCPTSGAPI